MIISDLLQILEALMLSGVDIDWTADINTESFKSTEGQAKKGYIKVDIDIDTKIAKVAFIKEIPEGYIDTRIN